MITRAQVQAKAREFLGTPFKNQHRAKGKKGGLDCVGLILLVAEELGIAYKDTKEMRGADYTNYHMARVHTYVLQECQKRLIEKPISSLKPGDIMLMRAPDVPCHTAIVTDMSGYLGMIHCYNGGKEEVVEHILDSHWRAKIHAVFSYPGVED